MAKKKSLSQSDVVGHNGTPFTKPRFDELAELLKEDPDTAFVWRVFTSFYNSSVIEAYQEMLETQKFFIGILKTARETFAGTLDKEDLNLAEEMMSWTKSLQGTTNAILEMRASLLSQHQAEEIESSLPQKKGGISLIDEMAAEARKKQKTP